MPFGVTCTSSRRKCRPCWSAWEASVPTSQCEQQQQHRALARVVLRGPVASKRAVLQYSARSRRERQCRLRQADDGTPRPSFDETEVAKVNIGWFLSSRVGKKY